MFREVIEPNNEQTKWMFQLTPMFKHMNLCVIEVGDNYFKVQEKDGQSGQFCWKISAVRRGFAGYRMEEDEPEGDVLTSNWEDKLIADEPFVIDTEVLESEWEDELL